jgi:hypothetical protein
VTGRKFAKELESLLSRQALAAGSGVVE